MNRTSCLHSPCSLALVAALAAFSLPLVPLLAGSVAVDETPGRAGEWGFRPRPGEVVSVTPPSFSWRPQKNAVSYALEVAREAKFEAIEYAASGIAFNVHCPPRALPAGEWAWRFRFTDRDGDTSPWSRARRFRIEEGAAEFPLPTREELAGRLPVGHPRLFVRPGQLPRFRELARGSLKPAYEALVENSERLVRAPPSTEEPPTYPPDVERLDERWREIWWGNREYTIGVLNGAATLGFTHLIDGNERYGQLARKLLLEAAEWDPVGSTGYRYNDEAGMPYAYYFSRAYTFVHDLLSSEERERCRAVMRRRGNEMYRHLAPRHIWRPYSSHSNRAWHFLGEVGITFHGEIEEAEDWLWFAMNVFRNVYPVWCDADGGWHEGVSYWRSYLGRFTWWADVMKAALDIDAYEKPYFSQAGYWPLYLQPPGTRAGGFGDLAFAKDASGNASLMRVLAAQAQNPHWQWYVETLGQSFRPRSYVDFVRGSLPRVTPRAPVDLPSSRVFRGVGQAVLNTNLIDGTKNIAVLFKASPFGTQSHGFEAQNAFQLYAFGEPLLIRTGRRDVHGSRHHREWMWETKSANSILVNGRGQDPHSATSVARISDYSLGKAIDCVIGEAGEAYGERLDRFSRALVFFKPSVVLVFDRLEAAEPSTYQWLLHTPTEMVLEGQHEVLVRHQGAACTIDFLSPEGLELSQTDLFDPPPRPRVKLRQFHLTATTTEPGRRQHFVTVLYPHRDGAELMCTAKLRPLAGGLVLEVALDGGKALAFLRTDPTATLRADGESSRAAVTAVLFDSRGEVVERHAVGE